LQGSVVVVNGGLIAGLDPAIHPFAKLFED
jgi:hypothetical protein